MWRGVLGLLLAGAAFAQGSTRIGDLIKVLAGPDHDAAFQAATELKKHGAEAAPSLVEVLAVKDDVAFQLASDVLSETWRHSRAHLQRGVKHADPAVRLGCALILQRAARYEEEQVPDEVLAVLVDGLKSPNRSAWALEALAQHGASVESALPLMRRLIRGSDEKMRGVAYRAYRDYGSKASGDAAFLGGLALGSDAEVAKEALAALGHLGPAAVPQIKLALEKGNEQIAGNAVKALGNQGAAAAELIPLLVQMHRRQKSVADLSALEALIDIGPDDKRVRAVLHEDIRAGGRRAAQVAWLISGARIVSREKVFPRSQFFHAELRMLLDADLPGPRAAAASRLAEDGVDVEKAWKTLLAVAEGCGDKEAYERGVAIRSLCSIGPPAAGAASRLIDLAARIPEARKDVVDGLPQIGRAAMPALTKALAAEGTARRVALECLEKFGPLAADAQVALAALAKAEGMAEAVERVTVAMGEFSPWPSNQILIDALRHESPDVRALAAGHYARGGGTGDRQYRDLLAELLKASRTDAVDPVRALAAQSFWAMTGDTAEVLPVLKELLRSADPQVRATICAATAVVAARGLDVPPEIKAGLFDLMLGDPNEEVRVAASEALATSGFPDDGVDRTLLALQGKDWLTRGYGAIAAAYYPDAADRTVPLLTAMLGDQDERLVQTALASLFQLGPRATAALPKLKAMREKASNAEAKDVLDQVIERVGG